ncbi:MAG: efflux RND transporter permease subunit [Gammaproteobacteria bacterium]|nr:efflux RND transporter permease subunit [Gammaproteobacteria bacterium]
MNGPISWFAHNHVAANLLLGVIVVAGLVVLPLMPLKSFPDIAYNVITVSVLYLGAAPEEAEDGVCIRIEEALEGIEGIERIRSTATEGVCLVTVELFETADASRALGDVKNRVDAIDTFPEETEKPIITLVTPQRPVMDIAVTGPTDEHELKIMGQRVRDEIAALRGVTQVELSNTRPYEISIEISEASLRRYGLSFAQVANAVRAASLDLPGGTIKTAGGDILLRTKGQAYWGAEFEDLVVLSRADGTRVYLRDVAQVLDGFEDTDQKLWFDGQPAALIQVARVGDQDILEITEAIHGYLSQASERLPEGVELTIWSDNSEMLRGRLDTLLNSARQGFLLVLLLLALFLRPRLSFWVSMGVPVAFLGALFLTSMLGLSIDGISTFGFILVLGILVDDAVVVGERVYSLQSREGPAPPNDRLLSAAVDGTREVSVPVIFGVLTTAAAFVPLMLAPGTIGQIQLVIGTVVLCCLAFSLIESQLILPSHLGHRRLTSPAAEVALMLIPLLAIVLVELAWNVRSFVALAIATVSAFAAWHLAGGFNRFAARLIELQQRFSDALEVLIQTRFRQLVIAVAEARYVTIAVAAAVLIATVGVLAGGHMPFSFFPSVPADRVTAKLTMPLGTPAEVTEQILATLVLTGNTLSAQLAAEAPDAPPVTHMLAAVGGHPASSGGGGPVFVPQTRAGGGHLAEVTLQLTPGEAREVGTLEVARRWREASGIVPDAVELTFGGGGFGVGAEIDIQLEGPDLEELSVVAGRIRNTLAGYPGVIDIADSFRAGKRELRLNILPAGEALGLSLSALARQVRRAFYGEEIQRIQRGRDDVRVMLRYTESERRTLDALNDMRIRTADGSEVPFATVARADLGRGFSAINRVDGRRAVNVTADVDRTVITANEVLAKFGAGPMQEIMRDYPQVAYSLEGAQREQGESMASLVPMFALALFIIYALLAVPLRSYGQPLIIMSVIPFAFVGAIWGHLIMKGLGMLSSLAIMSVLGIVAASGVVVNSSLVLVHGINARRREGLNLHDAVIEAAVSRFRPIMLTSLTTFAGLSPLLLNQSVQAAILIPMATSVAWGVILATLATLLVVPCGYLILEDNKVAQGEERETRAPEQTNPLTQ